MRITNIHIYAFGQHENLQLDFSNHINLLYGENEAGKTTIQQFILHVLFGFPARNRTLLRYEALHTTTYGGQVTIEDPRYGQVIIERVGGKSSGDVTVYFEDGKTGEEDALDSILRQYDRSAFESIFSFSLLQLQDFDKMDEETLSRTLFASGTTGVDDLLTIEAKMEKELGESYKRYGKKPVINEQIQKIQRLEKERLVEREKFTKYEVATNRLQEIEESLVAINMKQRQVKEKLEHARLQQQLAPLYETQRTLEERLQTLRGERFPIDGLTRYETFASQLSEAKATEKALSQQLEDLVRRVEAHLDIETMGRFDQFLQGEAEWHRLRSMLEQCRSTFKQLQIENEQALTRLGAQSEEQIKQLARANASLQQEEDMYNLLAQMEACQQELNEVEQALGLQEQTAGRLLEKQELLEQPDEEMIANVERWPVLQQRLADAKAYIALQDGQAKQLQMMKFSGYLFAALLLLIGVIGQQWLLIVSSVVLLGLLIFYMKKQSGIASQEEAEQTIREIEPIAEQIHRWIRIVETFEREHGRIHEDLSLIDQEIEQLTEQQQALKQEQAYTIHELTDFLQQYGILSLPSTQLIPELFRLIRTVQETMREMRDVKAQGQSLKQDIAQIMQDVEQQLGIEATEQMLYERIRQVYQEAIRKQEQQHSLAERRAHYTQQFEEIGIVIDTLTNQMNQLMEEAGVADQKDYYAMYEAAKERTAVEEQRRSILSQLDVYELSEFDWTLSRFLMNEAVDEAKGQLEHLDEERQQLVEEKAQLVHETTDLLTDESYHALIQQIEVEKANLAELAKEWAIKKAMTTAIIEMMNTLKEERFPAVLAKAKAYFRQLTGGNYRSLHMTEAGVFEVERYDGERFSIMMLSQATKEQAYISLRFALAETLQKSSPFPMIMDDPFVHFDEQRLQYMIQLLQQFTSTQFLYFTCHAQMKERFDQATIITIAKLEQKEGTKRR